MKIAILITASSFATIQYAATRFQYRKRREYRLAGNGTLSPWDFICVTRPIAEKGTSGSLIHGLGCSTNWSQSSQERMSALRYTVGSVSITPLRRLLRPRPNRFLNSLAIDS